MNIQNIHWYGQSGFRIEDDSVRMYIDPYQIPENLPKADFIFLTHAHFDHFSMEDIARIKTNHTIMVGTKDVVSKFMDSTVLVVPGQKYTIGPWTVETVPAYNLNKKFHPKERKWVGYIITLTNGRRIYHAGDSDFIPEMREIKTDIAMLPCGGTYTMTAPEAAEAAKSFHPALLIPMHYGEGLGSEQAGDEMKKLYHGETMVMTRER